MILVYSLPGISSKCFLPFLCCWFVGLHRSCGGLPRHVGVSFRTGGKTETAGWGLPSHLRGLPMMGLTVERPGKSPATVRGDSQTSALEAFSLELLRLPRGSSSPFKPGCWRESCLWCTPGACCWPSWRCSQSPLSGAASAETQPPSGPGKDSVQTLELEICFSYDVFKQIFVQPHPTLTFRGLLAFVCLPFLNWASAPGLRPALPTHSAPGSPSCPTVVTALHTLRLSRFCGRRVPVAVPSRRGFTLLSLCPRFSGHQKQVEVTWHVQSAVLNQKWAHTSGYRHGPSRSWYNNERAPCANRGMAPSSLGGSVHIPKIGARDPPISKAPSCSDRLGFGVYLKS